jgi:SAM-dependent methyltransferase
MTEPYLMGGQLSELDRLRLQSLVWEPAGRRLLAEIGDGSGKRVLDVGCGCLGWLRLLSEWVGPAGRCVGSDLDPALLAAASAMVDEQRLGNVEIVTDDLFASALPPGSFDLVHARFQLAPLGRMTEQLAAYLRLVRPGGILVVEEPAAGSWQFFPEAPASAELVGHILAAFREAGGDFDAGGRLPGLLHDLGRRPRLRADVVALPPGHAYLQLPLQFAASLRPRLLRRLPEAELDRLLAGAEVELAAPQRWGLSFTLVQTWTVV